MNYWTKKSADLAAADGYLDDLYEVYPIKLNARRTLTAQKEERIRQAFASGDDNAFLSEILDLDLFPIKDSFVAFLKRNKSAISKNPKTVDRIVRNLRTMDIDEIIRRCMEPKETNRQMGPMFKNWIDSGALGLPVFKSIREFMDFEGNCLLNMSDAEMYNFAKTQLGFNREKGIDFIARVSGKYIIGETKFLTDFGGHQNAQFSDAVSSIDSKFESENVIPVAIMDGVLYIPGNNKMYSYLNNHPESIIISALLLKDFLNSIRE